VLDAEKAIERLDRLTRDGRFRRNREWMADHGRGAVGRISDLLVEVEVRLNGDDEGGAK
jgi:hypothetical protein